MVISKLKMTKKQMLLHDITSYFLFVSPRLADSLHQTIISLRHDLSVNQVPIRAAGLEVAQGEQRSLPCTFSHDKHRKLNSSSVSKGWFKQYLIRNCAKSYKLY